MMVRLSIRCATIAPRPTILPHASRLITNVSPVQSQTAGMHDSGPQRPDSRAKMRQGRPREAPLSLGVVVLESSYGRTVNGSIAMPSFSIMKWTWGPVDMPVLPTGPIVSP